MLNKISHSDSDSDSRNLFDIYVVCYVATLISYGITTQCSNSSSDGNNLSFCNKKQEIWRTFPVHINFVDNFKHVAYESSVCLCRHFRYVR